MRRFVLILAVCLVTALAWCADEPPAGVPVLPCGQGAAGAPNCDPSKQDLKEAKNAYNRGIRLAKSHHRDDALAQFETAARLAPKNVDYLTARELERQDLVSLHLQQGNAELLKGQQVEALADFRSALQLDPDNKFAQQRLQDAIGEWTPKTPDRPTVVESAGEIEIAPEPVRANFHYQGDSKALLAQIATAFGLVSTIDDSVTAHSVRFDVTNVDFYTAMRAAGIVTKTFWAPLGEKQIIVAPDTPEGHRQFDRMALRTFWISGATTPTDLTDVVNALRSVFDIRFINQQPQASTITVRAPQESIDAATRFVESLGDSRPQVLLDVNIYEVSHTLMRNFGIHIPNQFNLFNIPAAALGALGGQNIQQLINQLIAGGGINQAGSTSLSALLAMLQNQQNSIFSNPLATFGGGLTLFGLSLDTAMAQLSLNESSIRHLEHATLRVAQGNEASYKIGSRFPILNASFAPIFNTAAIAQNIQNNTFQSAFPSFNYEDIGLTIKAKPFISSTNDVSLQLEMQIRALGTQSLNGVPVISNREYKGGITLLNGEPAVIAGAVSRTEQRSLSGIAGLGQVPGLNHVTSSNTKEEDDDELLVIITPHVMATAEHPEDARIFIGR
jgi:tetratricopeptide (TPR) repeat protein